jgi:enoyl-CoA hydratase
MPDITLDRADGVATITLSAPERRNALTLEMAEQLVQACDEIDADPSVGAVVVTGGEYFCAGGDRQTLADAGRDPATPDAWDGIGLVYRSFARVGELEPPTVAAIRGGAVGAGVNLAFATDLRVIASEAKIISGFLQIGLHPGGGHGVLLGRTGQREAAAAMALFGQGIDGARAAELGLAWAAVDDGSVEPTARELAAAPSADPELARRVARSLRAEWGPPALPWPAALDMERASQMWSMRRKDLQG